MIAVWLFLAVSWVCLQFVIVVFSDHTHLLFLRNLELEANTLSDIDLIDNTLRREGSPYLACNDINGFLTSEKHKNSMHGLVKMNVMR